MKQGEVKMSDDYDDYDDYSEDDYCYECSGYGDDYFVNEDGELECYCSQCLMNPYRSDD